MLSRHEVSRHEVRRPEVNRHEVNRHETRRSGPRRPASRRHPRGRVLGRALLALFIALSALVGVPRAACACSCAWRTTTEFVAGADVVARVVVERVEVMNSGPVMASNDPVRYHLRPRQVWKGPPEAQGPFVVESAANGASCGIEGVQVGDDLVLFAKTGATWQANLCGGTAPTSPTVTSELTAALGPARVVTDTGGPDAAVTRTVSSMPMAGDVSPTRWALFTGLGVLAVLLAVAVIQVGVRLVRRP